MVRIDIEWKFVSPFLQKASGILKIIEMEHVSSEHKILLECECHFEPGSIGFRHPSGFSKETFEKYEDIIHCMMYSYADGLKLDNKMFHWAEI